MLLLKALIFTTRFSQGSQGQSVLGITANSAIGLLGLLLFINILRVRLPRYEIDYCTVVQYPVFSILYLDRIKTSHVPCNNYETG